MQGTLYKIATTGLVSVERHIHPPGLARLQEVVGGYIETIPLFDRVIISDGSGQNAFVRCVAFCNETGKLDGLPVNTLATDLWKVALNCVLIDDYLVGDIAVLTGDAEFLAAI